MFSLDDRTGNVVTTVALFAAAAAVLYLARGAFFILLLSLFFAYLLEPAVTLVQRSRLGQGNRTWAIAQVYLVAALVLGSIGYALGPRVAAQLKGLNAALPHILENLSSGTPGTLVARHGLTSSQQQWIQDWLAGHRDLIVRILESGAASAGYVAASAIWLFAIPILAIFLLRDGREMAEAFIESIEVRRGNTLLTRVLRRVDTVLAKYIRAQLALAGLSFVFYSVSLLALGFPYAIALGFLGGVLEFLPAVGWIASAVTMLTIGFLGHAHWIWMAALVILWRLVQDYVNSPRVMGHTLDLQPLTVVFALMVGGQVGGIAGVFLSVPAVAVLRIVWLEYISDQTSTAAPSGRPMMQGKA